MAHPVRLHLLDVEDGEELMLAKFEECVAFTLIELLKIKQVLVERHCLFHIVHLDGDVIASIYLHAHSETTDLGGTTQADAVIVARAGAWPMFYYGFLHDWPNRVHLARKVAARK